MKLLDENGRIDFMTLAVFMIFIGIIMFLLGGWLSADVILKIGALLFIVGVLMGIVAKEYRKSKNKNNAPEKAKNAATGDTPLMISQYAALYVETNKISYKKEYLGRLKKLGISQKEAEAIFEFDCSVVKKYNKKYLLLQDFTQMWFFGLDQPFFINYPKEKDDIIKEKFLTISELCKIADEAEWHYWNSHERNLPNDVWHEIYEWRLRGNGMDFVTKYLDMISREMNVSRDSLGKVVSDNGLHLSKYKWN